MGNRATSKSKATLDPLMAGHKAAWQRWNSTRMGWETKVQQLYHMNFVYQMVWEPRGKELWRQHRDELIDTTLLAKRAWDAWQLTLMPANSKMALNANWPSVSISSETEHWATLLQETQPVWERILGELKHAIPDDTLFLPTDVRRLMADVHQAYHQIAQTTEKGMMNWNRWIGQHQDAFGKTSERGVKTTTPISATSRTRGQSRSSSLSRPQ